VLPLHKGKDYPYFDNINLFIPSATTTPDPTTTPSSTPEQTPTPVNAVLIEAEDYNSYYDTTAGNSGGAFRNDDVDIEYCHDSSAYSSYNIGWIENGEWLE
jgi:hypothetical protein